jgi:3-deoxy-D-manno-octulosonic-acid transferase
MTPILIDLLYLPLAILYLPFLLYQMIRLGKNRRGWAERFGAVPTRRSAHRCVWIHGVSLGEINATHTIVEELSRSDPPIDVVISSTTDTGFAAAKRLYPDRLVFRYPLDFSAVVSRTLRRINPSLILLMELEVWPNLVGMASRRGIAVAVANGRVTEGRSMKRFRLPIVRALARKFFGQLAFVAAQDETYAGRFAELGVAADRLCVTGSLKYDTAIIADRIAGDDDLADAMGIDRGRPLVVAGSTGEGEEAMVLDIFAHLLGSHPTLQLAIIPRKPERFDEVARIIRARGFDCVRRSEQGRHQPGAADLHAAGAVFLGDTMGELRKFYSLASVVFVGRTLVPMGGSDLMEVAALARPMCFGPFVDNFADVAEKLVADRAAVQARSVVELRETIDRLLADAAGSREMAVRGQNLIRANTGATHRLVELIMKTLGSQSCYG